MKCVKNNISFAFVNDTEISIEDYDKSIPAYCKNKHLLISCTGTHNRWHFRHACSDDIMNPLSDWHREWQERFDDEKLEVNYPTIKRRADIVEHNYIIEIQHSSISKDEVDHRNADYGSIGKDVLWVIDGSDIVVNGNVLTIDSMWKYNSFINCEFIFINVNEHVYKVKPSTIKSLTLHVLPIPKDDFITSIKENAVHLWTYELQQSKLYVKQQGAGNGKTWGSVNMLTCQEFQHYRKFIYVTKQHTAKNIIKEEFLSQCQELGTNFRFTEKNKKFIIDYENKKGEECTVVIATIDSFIYAVGNKTVQSIDMFKGIAMTIVEGHLDADIRGMIQYAGINPKLNAESLYVVDEAQDLNDCYAYAVMEVMKKTNMDVYVIGDKLQSIANEINAFTAFQQNGICEEPVNVCRRFIHPQLVDFVNHMVPFSKHSLPSIIPYAIYEDSDQAVYPMLVKQTKQYPFIDIEDTVSTLMYSFEKEVDQHNYVPENFLIVTPFVSSNPLANALDVAINEFWIRKLTESEYTCRITNMYWKDRVHQEYSRHCIIHKSEEGTSINLDESLHATRIVSIHAAKGDGREVVFLIDMTEKGLSLHTGKGSLKYDSLLHVALTRMKKTLYIFYMPDEIGRHITSWMKKTGCSFEVNDIHIQRSINTRSIVSEEINSLVQLDFIGQNDATQIIDMSNHNIRFAIMRERIGELLQDEPGKQQIKTQKRIAYKLPIQTWFTWKDFTFRLKLIKGFTDKDGNTQQERSIPLLKVKDDIYERYLRIIKECMEKVKYNHNANIPLCPLELITSFYMTQISQYSYQSKITIMELYTIINIYEKAYKHHMKGHDHCCCKLQFPNHDYKNSLSDYLHSHYEQMQRLDNIVEKLKRMYPFTDWNVDHHLKYYEREDPRFEIKTRADFVGYNPTQVILCYVTPNLTPLNIQDFKTCAILDKFIIMNQHETCPNYEKYHGKQVIICVIALNLDEPYVFDFEVEVSNLKQCIANSMQTIYELENKEMYYLFKTYRTKYGDTFKQRFVANWKEFKKETGSVCPLYIDEFMTLMNDKLRRRKTLDEIEETFLTDLNEQLTFSIEDFLKITL